MTEAPRIAPPAEERAPQPNGRHGRHPQAEPPASSQRRGYFLPGVIALAALLALGAAFGAGDLQHRGPSILAGRDVAEQLALAMQAQVAAPSAPSISCPSTEPVRKGLVFYCKVAPWRGAGRRELRVTEVDSSGRLSWSVVPARPAG
jgi:hypothetical protein